MSASSSDGTPLLTSSSNPDDGQRSYASMQPAASSAAGDHSVAARVSSPASSSAPRVKLPLPQPPQWVLNRREKGPFVRVTTTDQAITIVDNNKTTTIDIEDVIGVERVADDDSELIVHSYPPAKAGKPSQRSHVATRLGARCTGQEAKQIATSWIDHIQELLDQPWLQSLPVDEEDPSGDARRRRSILLLVNPAGGAGNAARNLESLMPMLQQSGIPHRILHTTHAGHASEVMRDLPLDSAQALTDVVCVSGDGLVHEVINGLMSRPDWSRAVRRLRLGHIGGGSGNGLASAICVQAGEEISLVSSLFLILKGRTRPLDVFSVRQTDERPKFGVLSMSYGVVSDIDLESESMRCLGNARFTVAALARICCLRRYRATLELLVDESEATAVEMGQGDMGFKCQPKEVGCPPCGHSSQAAPHAGRAELAAYLRDIEPPSAADSSDDLTSIVVAPAVTSAPAAAPGLQWVSIDDEFALLWSLNVSHGASDMHVAPTAHFSDGRIDVYYIRNIGRCSLLGLFLGMESGTHVSNRNIKSVKARGLRLTPRADRRSEITVDGERMPYKPTEVRVFQGVINLLAK